MYIQIKLLYTCITKESHLYSQTKFCVGSIKKNYVSVVKHINTTILIVYSLHIDLGMIMLIDKNI